jgi:Ca2+-binding RTX toxin-like protein
MVIKSGTNFSEHLKGTEGNDSLYGLGGNDTLTGYGGSDYLDGGTGNDSMQGGRGNDTYIVDSIFDIVKENSGQGIDTVKASVSYTLGSNVENLTLTGSSAINGTGNSLNNVITGNSGNNTLNGLAGKDTLNGAAGNDSLIGGDGKDSLIGGGGNDTLDGGLGADTMKGGDGSDTYIVDNVGDFVGESFNDSLAGVDTVLSSVSYSLAPGTTSGQQGYGIENLTLTGSGNINGTGNGNNNTITGNSGNNTLDGGLGADTMKGGDGSDTYIVDNVGDVVAESLNDSLAGIETVLSSVSYSLAPGTTSGQQGYGIENLTLTGSGNINGTGNGNNNTITGNSGNNTLDGGLGADTMKGGDGSDTYIVDNVGDVVAESLNDSLAGIDTVLSSVSYSLAPGTTSGQQGYGIENLTLTGSGNINGTGNGNNNTITGNSGNNTLNGLAGNDTLDGLAGNDTLIGGDGNDSLVGGLGNDSISGGNGNDSINAFGTSASIVEQYDTISGGVDGGFDTFILGGSWGVSYAGFGYATITDWNGLYDTLVLKGSASQYSSSTSTGDTTIYYNGPGSLPGGGDIVAILDNTTSFSFTSDAVFV